MKSLTHLSATVVLVAFLSFLTLLSSTIPSNVAWAQAPRLVGEWKWSHVGFTGTMRIKTQNPDGTFSGEFSPPHYAATIKGKVKGDQVEFVRSFTWSDGKEKEQRFEATLVGSGDNVRMVKGRVTGFDGRSDNGSWWGDFSAEKSPSVATIAAPGAKDGQQP